MFSPLPTLKLVVFLGTGCSSKGVIPQSPGQMEAATFRGWSEQQHVGKKPNSAQDSVCPQSCPKATREWVYVKGMVHSGGGETVAVPSRIP